MKVLEKGHITDSALEEYALNHLEEPELEVVEEHILICPTCQDRLQAVDDFVRAFRLAHERVDGASGPKEGAGRPRGFGGTSIVLGDEVFEPEIAVSRLAPAAGWFQRPVVWIGLAVALGIAALAPMWLASDGAPAPEPVAASEVVLVAQRGETGLAEAPAGRLALKLDLRGLGSGAGEVNVVALDGATLWRGALELTEAQVEVRPAIAFANGQYWVRVSGAGGALLREFGLRVR